MPIQDPSVFSKVLNFSVLVVPVTGIIWLFVMTTLVWVHTKTTRFRRIQFGKK